MAELRTIEKSFDAGILSVTGSILSLSDEYVIIPHLLYTSRKFDDYVITIIGPNGIFLLSYQMFINKQEETPIEDQIIYLREYAVRLNEYLSIRNIKLEYEPILIMVSDKNFPHIQGESDDPLIIPLTSLKKVIISNQVIKPITKAKISEITYVIRANGLFKRIHQYQLLAETDYTNSTITYLAYDTILDRNVLIKEIKDYTNPEEIEDLEKNEILREAKLTMQLQHKNIINIEQLIPKDGSLFVVIEWFEKASNLKQIMSKNRNYLEMDLAKDIIIQLCEALEHSHLKGIIHRNVRPENVLITDKNVVKLTNFDLAKKLDIFTRASFDLKQMIKENPYAAPEYRLGTQGHHDIDQRVDVYATGVVLYELLTNHLPVHLDERYWEPPSKYNTSVSEELDRIILQSIKFDPHQRFATVSALKKRLISLGEAKNEDSSENRYIDRIIFKRTPNSLIYQAYDKKYNKKVALKKVLLDTYLTNQQRKEKLEKLLAEAKIVSKLIHPNIVQVYDYFVEDSDGYIVMEWLEGKTLREIKSEINVLNIESILKICIQIGEALNYAHQQNIMHKDIKPENIMISDGKITILDFGIATFLEGEKIQGAYGTALYMAPEQLNNDWSIDQKVDIFSLGVLTYEMLTGRFPYEPSVIMGKYAKEVIINPISVSEINFACSSVLDAIIYKSIKVNPDKRYQRMSDFIYDLKSFCRRDILKSKSWIGNFKKIIPSLTIPALSIMLVISSLFIYIALNLFFKDNKEINEMPEVVLSINQSIQNTNLGIKNNNWNTATSEAENVSISADLIEYENITKINLTVNNKSDDEIIILNRSDEPSLLDVRDDLGNNYTAKVDLKSVSGDLIRIYPDSKASGSFEIQSNIYKRARSIYIVLSEYENKQRRFNLRLDRR